MTETTTSGEKSAASEANKRRGTRLMHAVGVTVLGTDPLGKQFREVTKTSVVSCFGCAFRSKSYAPKNSQIVLEISPQHRSHAPRRVTAKVIWIQRPQSLREQYQIAVALDVPGNVWHVEAPPEDWFPHPDDAPLEIAQSAPEEDPQNYEPLELAASAEAASASAVPDTASEEVISLSDLVPTEPARDEANLAAGPVTAEEIIFVRQQLEDRIEETIRAMVRSMVERAADEAVKDLARETSERALAAIDDVRKTSEALAGDLDAKIRRVLDDALHAPWTSPEKPSRKKRLKQNKPKI